MTRSLRVLALALSTGIALAMTGCLRGPAPPAATATAPVPAPPVPAVQPAGSLSEEIRDATARWVRRGDDLGSLRGDLERVAQGVGVRDWSRQPGAYRAIGEGLRQSGLRNAALESVKDALAKGHPQALTWINAGYYSGVP